LIYDSAMDLAPQAEPRVSPDAPSHPALSLFRLGAATGIATGSLLTLAGLLCWITGIGKPFVDTVGSLLRGYGAGPVSALIGGVWGASAGFAFGAALGWIYNRAVD
jgi:hypothetical protein